MCRTMSTLSFTVVLCGAVADFVAHRFIFVGIFCFIKIYILWYVHDVCTLYTRNTYTRIYCRIKSIKAGEILPSTAAERLHKCHFFDVDERMKVVRSDVVMEMEVRWVAVVVVVVMERLCRSCMCDGNGFVVGTFVLAIFLFMVHLWAISLGMVKYVSLFYRFKW